MIYKRLSFNNHILKKNILEVVVNEAIVCLQPILIFLEAVAKRQPFIQNFKM